jgi:hypothetical protein
MLTVLVGLCALSTARAPLASADVCSGGAPYAGPGSPEGELLHAVPFLAAPRWSREVLPQWRETSAEASWADGLAYAWYTHAALWSASEGTSWWVIPAAACADEPDPTMIEGNLYASQDCVLIYQQLAPVGFDCLDLPALAHESEPVTVRQGADLLVAGFTPMHAGSVEVTFQNGTATLPVVGGVYGGAVSSSLGPVVHTTYVPTVAERPVASVVLVDQTGIESASQGPLASTPRLRALVATLHARAGSINATLLGTSVRGLRAHNEVLYGPGSRPLAATVARVLHAARPSPFGPEAAKMFRSVAHVVVLVGRSN